MSSANQFFFCCSVSAHGARSAHWLVFFPSSLVVCLVGGTSLVALHTGGFTWRDAGSRKRCRRRPSIRVRPLWPKHLSLFSPTGDLSKPGTGTTLLFYGGDLRSPGTSVRSPGPVFNATKPSFHSNSLDLLGYTEFTTYTGLAWRSGVRLCRRATGRGIARPTAYREVPGSAGPTGPAELFCRALGRRSSCLENASVSHADAYLAAVTPLRPWNSSGPSSANSPNAPPAEFRLAPHTSTGRSAACEPTRPRRFCGSARCRHRSVADTSVTVHCRAASATSTKPAPPSAVASADCPPC